MMSLSYVNIHKWVKDKSVFTLQDVHQPKRCGVESNRQLKVTGINNSNKRQKRFILQGTKWNKKVQYLSTFSRYILKKGRKKTVLA